MIRRAVIPDATIMMMKQGERQSENQKIPKTIKLDDIHWKIIQDLIPFYGNSAPEVVRTIVIMWLHENIGSEAIRKLEELGVVQFK